MLTLDDIFEMGGGYVLNFSNDTFARFFAEELDIDIDDPKYSQNGGSKGKRLRYFLQIADKQIAIRTLTALWEYREACRDRAGRDEWVKNAHGKFTTIIDRLGGTTKTDAPTAPAPTPAFNREKISQLKSDLIGLQSLAPQPRGYAFEGFLKDLFHTFGLEPRGAFRLQGEQIDGSFALATEIYLLEAKWHNSPVAIGDLHNFHGKIEQKAAWARGLLVSYAGFTEDGLHAFGRGKRVICMDGLDLYELLHREIPLNKALEAKVRRAAETGSAFVRVRDLFG
jgi:hypothetical protein